MTREELIKVCKYYKGENECPYTNDSPEESIKGHFWNYEKYWIESDNKIHTENVGLLKAYGLENFNANDGTPISLKALLFNRWGHWVGLYDIEGFKKWYLDEYLQSGK